MVSRCVTSWPMYFVNGHKFYMDTSSHGKKTIDSGVYEKGSTNAEDEIYYYGILKDMIALVYLSNHKKWLFFLNVNGLTLRSTKV